MCCQQFGMLPIRFCGTDVLSALHLFSCACSITCGVCIRNVHLQGVATIRIVLQALLHSLKRYADDLPYILSCCQVIGRRHASDFVVLVDELLKIERSFLIPEPVMDDLFCRPCFVWLWSVWVNWLRSSFLPRHMHGGRCDECQLLWAKDDSSATILSLQALSLFRVQVSLLLRFDWCKMAQRFLPVRLTHTYTHTRVCLGQAWATWALSS